MVLPCNVGGADKTFRIVLGLALIALVLFVSMSTLWMVAALVVAIIALTTAFVGYCPLNRLLGIDTCKAKRA